MNAPRLLDLFCGAGGAAMGYHRAGFDVTGVDLEPQPDYPFTFVRGDAMTFPLAGFDAIHASPPCIRWTVLPLTREQREKHPDLLTPIRERLIASGVPYVIENIWKRAPLRGPVLYCGAAMNLKVIVHRGFESNCLLLSPGCACPPDATTKHGFVNRRPRGPLANGRKSPRRGESQWREAAGLDHLIGQAARNAIPPAYTEHIGTQLLQHLAAVTL